MCLLPTVAEGEDWAERRMDGVYLTEAEPVAAVRALAGRAGFYGEVRADEAARAVLAEAQPVTIREPRATTLGKAARAVLEQAAPDQLRLREEDGVLWITVRPRLRDLMVKGPIVPAGEYEEVALGEIVDRLQKASGMPIEVRWRALEFTGVEPTTPLTLTHAARPVEQVLQIVMNEASGGFAELVAVHDDGQLILTTIETLDDYARTMAINLAFLAAGDAHGRNRQQEALLAQLQDTVRPEHWRANGGTVASGGFVGDTLVITADLAMLVECEQFIRAIARARGVEPPVAVLADEK